MDDKKEDDILDSLEEEMFEEDEEESTEDISALSDEIHQKMDELKQAITPEEKAKKSESNLDNLTQDIRAKIPQVADCTLVNSEGKLISSTMTDKEESGIFGRTTAKLTKSAIRALTESSYGNCEHIILTGSKNQIVVKSFGEYILATKLDKNINIGMYLIKIKSYIKDRLQ